jgi:PAS domain S-box-containing protein
MSLNAESEPARSTLGRPDHAALALAGSLDAWVCWLDGNGVVVWSNPVGAETLGMPPSALTGRRWVDLLTMGWPAESPMRTGLAGDLAAALAEGRPWSSDGPRPPIDELPLNAASLRRWHLQLVPTAADDAGDLRRFWAIARVAREDADSRRLAFELAHQRTLLDVIRRFGRIGVWERDVASGQGVWDPTMYRLFGLDPAGGPPPYEQWARHIALPPERFDDFLRSTQVVGDYQARFPVRLADGTERLVRSQWAVLPGPDGAASLVIGVMSDETEWQRMSQSFGEAAEQLRLAVDVAGVGLWIHDLRTQLIHYNAQSFRLIGEPPRVGGLDIAYVRSLIHPDDLPTVLRAVEQALDTNLPVTYEARYRHADGQYRVILGRRVLQRDDDNQPKAFLGVSIDITDQVAERRRAQDLVRRLDQTVAAAGLGIWTRDLDTGITEWNTQLHRICGIDPSQPPPDDEAWIAMVDPADRPIVTECIRSSMLEPGIPRECKFRLMRADGSVRWIEHRATFESAEGQRRMSGIAIDATARVDAELAMRTLSDRTALATRSAGIGTWSMDVPSGAAEWDAQMFLLRGLEPGPLAPSPAMRRSLVHPDDQQLFNDGPYGSTQPDEAGARSYEFRIIRPDLRVRWLASRSKAITDETGRLQKVVGVNWDITELKEAAQALQEREAALRQSQAKSEFMARMSHELRTPLNAVLGFAQLLEREMELGQPIQRMKVAHIRSAGEHLLSLINDVLELASVESGNLKLERQPIRIASTIAEALPMIESARERRGVTVRVLSASGSTWADPIRLRQVVMNLLSNAVKYNRPGGDVRVLSRLREDRIMLRVEDDGPGMSAEQVAHLFEPFNRLGADAQGIEGTGIGLVIVKALTEAMGGTVQVHSERGRGTAVVLDLPRALKAPARMADAGSSGDDDDPDAADLDDATDAASAAPDPAPTPVDTPPGSVLYIEDNEVNVLLVREIMRAHTRLELDVAHTGSDGIGKARHSKPGLVLVDMQLPDMDGYEVLRRLRSDPRTADLTCVALSANAMREDIQRARDEGFADYWTKPIDFKAFVKALNAHFPT